jgi:hypothetical protein
VARLALFAEIAGPALPVEVENFDRKSKIEARERRSKSWTIVTIGK